MDGAEAVTAAEKNDESVERTGTTQVVDPERERYEQRLRRNYGAVAASAILSFCAFHPVDAGVLAYVALVPLLFVAAREKPLVAVGMAYCVTVLYHIPGLAWIATTTPPGWLTTSFMEGGYGITLICVPLWLRKRSGIPLALSLPLLGAALECIRGNFPFIAFPWLFWGHSQHAFTTLIQIADVTSVYGLTAFVLLVNGAIADVALLAKERSDLDQDFSPADLRRIGLLVAAPLVIGLSLFVYGTLRIRSVRQAMEEAGPGPRLLVVQANVPQSLKDGVGMSALELADVNLRLTDGALKWNGDNKVDGVLWSETMWPWPLMDRREEAGGGRVWDKWLRVRILEGESQAYANAFRYKHRELFRVPVRAKAPIFVGAADWGFETKPPTPHNSYYRIGADGRGGATVTDRYDKVELVPVSEYIPYKSEDSWLHWFHKFMKGFVPPGFEVFERGKGPVLMDANGFKLSPNICFEISFPELLRQGTLEGADVHVCPANDAWFVRGGLGEVAKATAEIDLARAHTKFRAIENRRSVVRCVNRGVSLCMDPTGEVTAELTRTGEKGEILRVGFANFMAVTAPVTKLKSFYVRFGNVFAIFCGLASLVLVVAGSKGKLLFPPTEGVARPLPPPPEPDSEAGEASESDAGESDASESDASESDAGESDAGESDASESEGVASEVEASESAASEGEGHTTEASETVAGEGEAGTTEESESVASEGDASASDAGTSGESDSPKKDPPA